MYQNVYYPYKAGCPVRKDYCTAGKSPQIPAPSKPGEHRLSLLLGVCRHHRGRGVWALTCPSFHHSAGSPGLHLLVGCAALFF